MRKDQQDSLTEKNHDAFIGFLNQAVVLSVKLLCVLMVIVIWLTLIDVVMNIVNQAMNSLSSVFETTNLINDLGNFLIVLIAIEIFLNITFYLKKHVVHVPLVLATALTAVARKVIVLDYTTCESLQIIALASVILAVGVSYWLITKRTTSLK